MGRKKIKIQPIKEDRNRSVTYLKRKAGLFKKAHELAVLTDSQVAVIVFGHNGKLAEFCSTDIDLLLLRYTEYEGVAERKGPQNYGSFDKDSDDNDDGDNDNDDNDHASGDGPDDDSAGQGGANGDAGGGGSSGVRGARVSGIKRKVGSSSAPRNSQSSSASGNTGTPDSAAFRMTNTLQGASPSAKRTINAAIRQKNQNRFTANPGASGQPASQGGMETLPFGQTLLPIAALPHNTVAGTLGGPLVGANHVVGQAAATASSPDSARDHPTANMSISMPANDRGPTFASHATPGFGMTPGGTVTTPGGRRFSFSDVLTRGSSGLSAQRPVTASSLMGSTFFQDHNAFGLSDTPQHAYNSLPPDVSTQSPHNAATATFAVKGTMQKDASFRPSGGGVASSEPFPNADLMPRPASTGFRPLEPIYNGPTYTPVTGSALTSHTSLASPAHIVRPLTASGNLEAPASSSTHLGRAMLGFQGSSHPHLLPVNSASNLPHPSSVDVTPNDLDPPTFNPNQYGAGDLRSSVTPLASQANLAAPKLIQHRSDTINDARPTDSGSRTSMLSAAQAAASPSGNARAHSGVVFSQDVKRKPSAVWVGSGHGIEQKTGPAIQGQQQSMLVQPVPFNALQSFGPVPFDLSFPADPVP